jgi:hypothetical protein
MVAAEDSLAAAAVRGGSVEVEGFEKVGMAAQAVLSSEWESVAMESKQTLVGIASLVKG